jgi:pantothenate kinase type III
MENKEILFADIGNSSIDLLFVSDTHEERFKVLWRKNKFSPGLAARLAKVEHCYISSVNQEALDILKEELWSAPTSLLTRDEMTAFASEHHYIVDNLDILGSDLFCDIVAIDDKKAQIIIDLGTASKILYISENKKFYGSMIFPSPLTYPETLNAGTDLLKNIALKQDSPIVSLKTEECISSGMTHGTAALVSSTVKKIKQEFGPDDCLVILTGGNRFLIETLLPEYGLKDVIIKDNLVLDGLRRIYLK